MTGPLLEARGLSVTFPSPDGEVAAVSRMDFAIAPGETVAIVGESGSGKSTFARALLRLTPAARVTADRLAFKGEDLLSLPPRGMQAIRGSGIAMVFQEPMASFDPLMRVGEQIAEPLIAKLGLSRRAARDEAIRLLASVGIADPEARYHQYPHNFSGGMLQRAMIAIAVSCGPSLIIADEPTTALDVTVQAQVLAMLAGLNRERGTAIVLITHNLAIVPSLCERIVVMYGGRVVEAGRTEEVLAAPAHPYTDALLRSVPTLGMDPAQRLDAIPGQPPRSSGAGPGCPFAPRCERVLEACATAVVELRPAGAGRQAACIALDGLEAAAE
jgi:oligopeptide/dipeptide ABC transporter ATP-binding protein